jgi:polyphosphate glucokinase
MPSGLSPSGPAAAAVVGVDVGGSSIKGYLVDAVRGRVIGEGIRAPSPGGFRPAVVLDAVAAAAEHLGPGLPVGVGFPAVVRDGVLLTNPTSHEYPGWKGMALEAELSARLGRRVVVGNDADVAGGAELRLGAARGASGTVLVLTFGTGIGSGLFRDGVLVPNVELGRLYLAGHDAVVEDHCAARVRTELGLSWADWAGRLQELLDHIERTIAPDLIVFGGAVSAEHENFLPLLQTRCAIVPAALGNGAGPLGAALMAAAAQAVA